MKTTLYFFTAEYPYGKGENFIEAELEYHSKYFEQIVILPYTFFDPKDSYRSVPANCKVVNFEKNKGSKSALLKNPTLVSSILQGSLKKRPVSEKKNLLHEIANYIYVAEELEEIISLDHGANNAVFYSYWFDHWTSILGILKRKKIINSFCTRAHGYDLYDDRHKYPIPFRTFQMKQVSKVFTISKSGSKYLSDKFPSMREKIELAYLGTRTPKNTKAIRGNETLQLLTISSLHPVKRVGRLISALSSVKRNVKWTHFGNDAQDTQFDEDLVALPSNVEVEWKGMVSNSELIRFLESNWIDVFVNVSESEGLPVSIMEAISFGIPVIATDVGGTSEIVQDQNGLLIPKEFDSNFLSSKIENFDRLKYDSNQIQDFWKSHFCAEVNFDSFAKNLVSQ